MQLTIGGIAACAGSEDDIGLFIRAVRWIADREANFEPTPEDPLGQFTVAKAEAAAALGMAADSLPMLRLGEILLVERWGWTSGAREGSDWRFTVGREVQRFADIQTLEDFLVEQAAWGAEASAEGGERGGSREDDPGRSRWSRQDKLTVLSIVISVLLGLAAVVATINPEGVACALHVGQCSDESEAAAPPSSKSSTEPRETNPAGAAPMTILVPHGQEVPLDLSSGGAQFRVPARWRISASGTSQLCTFQVVGVGTPYRRYLYGQSLVVHGRRAGIYQIRSPDHCEIAVRGDDEDFVFLPVEVDSTGQSSASVVFESDGPFVVSMSPGTKCGASVYREWDGARVGQGVGAGSERAFTGPGRFWVETEAQGCRLVVRTQ
jgi:hypothetical protein